MGGSLLSIVEIFFYLFKKFFDIFKRKFNRGAVKSEENSKRDDNSKIVEYSKQFEELQNSIFNQSVLIMEIQTQCWSEISKLRDEIKLNKEETSILSLSSDFNN